MNKSEQNHPFDAETWAQLPSFLDHLPKSVLLVVWGEENGSRNEQEAVTLCRAIAEQFDAISFKLRPRRINYPYYPVIGIMGDKADNADNGEDAEWDDFGVRIIGLPEGYQMTSFITAVQAVAFRGTTLSVPTRVKLSQLKQDVQLTLLTSAENEAGPLMTQMIFNLAAANSHVRSFMIMSDQFPDAVLRYSVNYVPHIVVNGRIHLEGVVDEATLLEHIAKAVSSR